MDYVKKFLHVERIIGQGAFGRVLVTSPLQNTIQPTQQQQSPDPTSEQEQQHKVQRRYSLELDGSQAQQIPGGTLNYLGHLSPHSAEENASSGQSIRPKTTNNSDHIIRRFALKCVHPLLKPQRLANELRHLRDLGGMHNVVQMHTAHFNKGSLYIVMDLFEHDRFIEVVAQLEYEEIVMYMENLLEALEHVHSHSIMHRDIKPANFLYNRKYKRFLLIDFGLAQKVRPRTGLFDNRTSTATTPIASNFTMLFPTAPSTPTSTPVRRQLNSTNLDLSLKRQDHHSKANNDNTPIKPTAFINLNSTTHIIQQSPARHYFNLTQTGSPITPSVASKRHLAEVNNTTVNLKKLRVSNNDELREPVKLTVGAYESPITSDGSGKRIANYKSHNFQTPTIPSRRRNLGSRCDCKGKPRTCNLCQSRPDSNAPRSGTPGYKAPEILLRATNQTTAVDIWSAGVMFACLLSGHSPFLRDTDDNASLAEIITLLGSRRVAQAAKSLSISLQVEPKREPVDLMQLCKKIRLNNKDKRQIQIPDEAFDLLTRMLDPNPTTRITAKEALREHAWLTNIHLHRTIFRSK